MEYSALSEAIVPKEWTEGSIAAANAIMADYAARKGEPALHQAMSGGQYHHPDGIFYGSTAPSWSRITAGHPTGMGPQSSRPRTARLPRFESEATV